MTIRAVLLLAFAAVVQVTLLGRLDPALPVPNLVLALCAARSWTRGGRAGMSWALVGGFLLDLGGGVGPLGVHALATLAAAYSAGAFAAMFDDRRPVLSGLGGAVAGLVYGGVLLALADVLRLAVVSLHQALPLLAVGVATTAVATALVSAALERSEGPRRVAPQW